MVRKKLSETHRKKEMELRGQIAIGTLTNSEGRSPIHADVLRIWNACRFVRMGWIKAREAVILVELFFQNMFPFSPILTDFYNTPENSYWLVTQEPMLCCTILMISSKYHVLPGFGGTSRAYSIHNRLWQHYQHLLLRIMLGQEKLSKAKTRHVGSIEALLLMCEWYPRALNFPLENDGWDSDLILTEPDLRDPPASGDEIPMSDRWKEDVVEPTRRSDRMSWMLVSTALALAHELGIFRSDSGKRKCEYDVTSMRSDAGAYLQQLEWRRRRLPSLLYVFASMLASRLGCTSLVPEMPVVNVSEGITDCPYVENEWMHFMASWVDLTRLAKDITDTHFPSIPRTGDPMRDCRSSQDWESMLYRWQASRPTLNSHLESILHVEYQYLQVFTNSIKVQSLVENILHSPTQSATTDRTCIDEVINRSTEILQWLLIQPSIQYLPIRVFLRVISSSIFLMKALALGVRTTQLHASLHLLEQTITTLQSSPLDDMQLISRYASLLQIHVSRLRQTFMTSAQEREKDVQSERQEHSNTLSSPGQTELVQGSHDPMLGQLDESGDDWLWLPIDPLMAPFGTWDDTGQLDYGLDSAHLDLDFIWNLPP
ncbi:putative C6 transcription factor Aro80 [Aspergillus bombycis]|uniref:Putative C6 transcription factor Aro80 n=1 Tax=Aspergillus bombycis TaxID=109264 RepID=A0A1F8A8H6_9EURO|nr:putative C6 transcription factor Aro80 [Aspergillus bombycis]OGM47665.1 putative C6 transcription factor Aro80 [Aspergillus bombycis]